MYFEKFHVGKVQQAVLCHETKYDKPGFYKTILKNNFSHNRTQSTFSSKKVNKSKQTKNKDLFYEKISTLEFYTKNRFPQGFEFPEQFMMDILRLHKPNLRKLDQKLKFH